MGLTLVGLQGGSSSPLVPVWIALVVGEAATAERRGWPAVAAAIAAAIGASADGVAAPLVIAVLGVVTGVHLAARRVRAELRQARVEADTDPLTGLGNRWAIDRRFERLLAAQRRNARLSVLALDLDDFRTINREHGHDAGDRAIQAAADRIVRAIPEAAVARLGGDEFLVVLDGKFNAGTAAQRLGEAIASHPIEGRTLTASVGIARAPEHGTSWQPLRKAADDALRAAKAAGKSRSVIYDADLSETDPSEAVQALWRENRIRIVAQPIVDLRRGRVRSYEALARFTVSGDGSPQRWFALAERAGLRAELELACLERSLERAASRPAGTRFAVNLSPEMLERADVLRLLEGFGDLHGLVLELTENGVVEDYERLQVLLEPLYERGLQLAVDDFGAGRANMHHVSALRPRFLKLDRSLVTDIDRDPQKVALIEALARYAERIDSYLIAEGVERRGELEQLVRIGVTFAQGYYLGPPGAGWPQLGASLEREAQGRALVGSLDALIAPVHADVPAMELYERLAEEPSLLGFAVVDQKQRVLGLIARNALLLKLSARFGFSLYGGRPAIQIADRSFVSARRQTSREELVSRALSRPPESRFDPVVILDEQDRMDGYLTMESLLEEATLRTSAPAAVGE